MKPGVETVKLSVIRGKIGGMSKPFELTIFPFIENEWTTSEYRGIPVHSRFDGWRTPAGDVPEMFIDSHVAEKRLTGAELAAEFHRACYEFKMSHDMADLIPGPDTWSDLYRDTGWMYAMERFATLPHHDEAAE